ncbi:metal-dependent hydrolase [Candidatus Woesearchaeota archaeon]|nr:metal-dependent hydrolase [Candidatus Woesearchaeota archaeon]
MIFTTHLLAGLLLWKTFKVGFWAFVLGAVILDIDHLYVYIKQGIYNPITMFKHSSDPKYGNHRTHWHSIIGVFVISFVVWLFNREFGLFFGLGMLSHISLDALDKKGITFLFYPVKGYQRGIFNFNVITELIVTSLLICTVLLLL